MTSRCCRQHRRTGSWDLWLCRSHCRGVRSQKSRKHARTSENERGLQQPFGSNKMVNCRCLRNLANCHERRGWSSKNPMRWLGGEGYEKAERGESVFRGWLVWSIQQLSMVYLYYKCYSTLKNTSSFFLLNFLQHLQKRIQNQLDLDSCIMHH